MYEYQNNNNSTATVRISNSSSSQQQTRRRCRHSNIQAFLPSLPLLRKHQHYCNHTSYSCPTGTPSAIATSNSSSRTSAASSPSPSPASRRSTTASRPSTSNTHLKKHITDSNDNSSNQKSVFTVSLPPPPLGVSLTEAFRDGQKKVIVTSVRKESPAHDLIHVGDIVTSAAGIPAKSLAAIVRKIQDDASNQPITFILERINYDNIQSNTLSSSTSTSTTTTTTTLINNKSESNKHSNQLYNSKSSSIHADDLPSLGGIYTEQEDLLYELIQVYNENRKVNDLFAASDLNKVLETSINIIEKRSIISSKNKQLIFSILSMLKKSNVPLNNKFYNLVMINLINCKHANLAIDLFDEIQNPTIECYTTLIKAYSTMYNKSDDCISMISIMRSKGITPNIQTYNAIITSCVNDGKLIKAKNLFSEMLVDKIRPNVVSWNIIINWYVKQHKGLDRLKHALNAFEDMKDSGVSPDVVTFTTVMKAYTKSGYLNKAEEVFSEMKRTMPNKIDATVYNTLLSAYAYKLDWRRCLELFDEMIGDNLMTRSSHKSNALNSSFNGFGGSSVPRHSRTFSRRRPWLEEDDGDDEVEDDEDEILDENRNDKFKEQYYINDENENYNYDESDEKVTDLNIKNRMNYNNNSINNSNINGYTKYTRPNFLSFSLVIKACADSGHTERARQIFEKMMEFGFYPPNSLTVVSLLNGYAKTGQLGNCFEVLKSLKTWGVFVDIKMMTAVMNGCLIAQRAELALSLYSKIENSKLKPDVVTYTLLIQAYGQLGQLNKMFGIIQQMLNHKSKYCHPNIVTYNKLIELCLINNNTQLALEALHLLMRNKNRNKKFPIKINKHCMDCIILPIVPEIEQGKYKPKSNRSGGIATTNGVAVGSDISENDGSSMSTTSTIISNNVEEEVAKTTTTSSQKHVTNKLSDSEKLEFLQSAMVVLRNGNAVPNGIMYRALLLLCERCGEIDFAESLMKQRSEGLFLMHRRDSIHVRVLEEQIRAHRIHSVVQ